MERARERRVAVGERQAPSGEGGQTERDRRDAGAQGGQPGQEARGTEGPGEHVGGGQRVVTEREGTEGGPG